MEDKTLIKLKSELQKGIEKYNSRYLDYSKEIYYEIGKEMGISRRILNKKNDQVVGI